MVFGVDGRVGIPRFSGIEVFGVDGYLRMSIALEAEMSPEWTGGVCVR